MKTTSVPTAVRSAITGSVTVMLASASVPQQKVDAALVAFFNELDGKGSLSLTDARPLDRVVSRRQAAELLNCSTISISRKVASGKLRAIYGGANGQRLTGISSESLRELLNQRKGNKNG